MNKINIQNIIYNSGDIFLPEHIKIMLRKDLIGSSKKTFYLSRWSIVHLINGIIFGYLYLYFNYDIQFYALKLFIIHTIWEMWQILIGMSKPYNLTGNNNLMDTILDTIIFMSGAFIARKYY